MIGTADISDVYRPTSDAPQFSAPTSSAEFVEVVDAHIHRATTSAAGSALQFDHLESSELTASR